MTEGYPALETYVAVLSTAPVGPSDQIGTANKTLIMATWSVRSFSLNFMLVLILMKLVLTLWPYRLIDDRGWESD